MVEYSFSSANTFPMKFFFQPEFLESCRMSRKVFPLHLQLNPTNKCQFNCQVCSCSARDRSLELPLEELVAFLDDFRMLGGQSVTVTGGGEPTLYGEFRSMVEYARSLGLELGLVTNAVSLGEPEVAAVLKEFTWIRVSSTDSLPMQLEKLGLSLEDWFKSLRRLVHENQRVDWAFSHVLSGKANPELVASLIRFANSQGFTHVRVVNDIFVADELEPVMLDLKESMTETYGLDVSRVNFQDRSSWTEGVNPCLVSLVKPVVGADGYLYPCCGTQYAQAVPSRDYGESMRMAPMSGLRDLVRKQEFFNGAQCVKCYYSAYNEVLRVLVGGLKHVSFV